MPTLRTSDMHATLVLLDWGFTFRAWFRVNLDPAITGLTCPIRDLFIPANQCVTLDWSMRLLIASKAE